MDREAVPMGCQAPQGHVLLGGILAPEADHTLDCPLTHYMNPARADPKLGLCWLVLVHVPQPPGLALNLDLNPRSFGPCTVGPPRAQLWAHWFSQSRPELLRCLAADGPHLGHCDLEHL